MVTLPVHREISGIIPSKHGMVIPEDGSNKVHSWGYVLYDHPSNGSQMEVDRRTSILQTYTPNPQLLAVSHGGDIGVASKHLDLRMWWDQQVATGSL